MTTLLTERTKRKRDTRNIDHTNTAEVATQLKHTSRVTHTAAIKRAQKGKWLATDRVKDFQLCIF